MNCRPYLVSLVAALLIVPATASLSEVIHGTVTIRPNYVLGFPPPGGWDEAFDFATQTLIPMSDPNWDLTFAEDIRGGTWNLGIRHAGNIYVTTAIEDVDVAPTLDHRGIGIFSFDGTYVLKTVDNLYVKFALLGWANIDYGLNVEYYVQTDGSPNFGPSLPVRTTTWGQVKALYR